MLATSSLWSIVALTGVISAVLTAAVRYLTLRHNLLDIPNDRSSHKRPTPTSAGVAIVLSFVLCAVGAQALGVASDDFGGALVPLLTCSAFMALVGLVDDLRSLSAGLRFLLQIAAAVIFCAWYQPLTTLNIPGWGTVLLGPVAMPFSVLWLAAMTNFYNFMDGIDGIAGGTGVLFSLFAAAALVSGGGSPLLPLMLAAGCLGFLSQNFPPARIFMGDVGSAFLGFFFAALTIVGNQAFDLPVTALVLGLGMFILDTSVTLVRRMARGERWYAAHRSHFYQRLVQAGWSHRRVDMVQFALTALCCGAGYAYLLVDHGFVRLLLTAIVVAAFTGFARLVIAAERKLPTPQPSTTTEAASASTDTAAESMASAAPRISLL